MRARVRSVAWEWVIRDWRITTRTAATRPDRPSPVSVWVIRDLAEQQADKGKAGVAICRAMKAFRTPMYLQVLM